ncbi:MAG: hypothetical protein ACTILK_00295 [Bifidobacterium crudilactis]|uniref:hypothetical protein n=1 Tax=Bifidobacterium crudilactis TaxID=327277 RepID=UPI003F94A7C5
MEEALEEGTMRRLRPGDVQDADESMRDHLLCPECFQKAYFVDRTAKGVSYFGSRYHTATCTLRSGLSGSTTSEALPEGGTLIRSDTSFSLRRGTTGPAENHVVHNPEADPAGTRARRFTKDDGPSTTRSTMRPKALLHRLATNTLEFRSIHIAGTDHAVEQYCLRADSIDKHLDGDRIIWGRIIATNSGKPYYWLQSGPKRGVNIAIADERQIPQLLAKANIHELKQLQGKYFLWHGPVTSGRHPYLKVGTQRLLVFDDIPDATELS